MLSARSASAGAPTGGRNRSKPSVRHRTPPRLNDPTYHQKPSVWRNLTSFSGTTSRPSIFSILNLDPSPKDPEKQDEEGPAAPVSKNVGAETSAPSPRGSALGDAAENPFAATTRDMRASTTAVTGWCSVDDFLREDAPFAGMEWKGEAKKDEAPHNGTLLQALVENHIDEAADRLPSAHDILSARQSLATSASAFSFSPKAKSAGATTIPGAAVAIPDSQDMEPASQKSSSSSATASSSSISTASEGHSGSSTSITHDEREDYEERDAPEGAAALLPAKDPQAIDTQKSGLQTRTGGKRPPAAAAAAASGSNNCENQPRTSPTSTKTTVEPAAISSANPAASKTLSSTAIMADSTAVASSLVTATAVAAGTSSATVTAASLLASSLTSKTAAKPPRKRACSKGSAASLARCTMSRTPRTSGEPGPGNITPRSTACPQSARRSQMDAAQVIEAEAHINSIFARLEARISKATASYADMSASSTPRDAPEKPNEPSEKQNSQQQQATAVSDQPEQPLSRPNLEQPEPPPPFLERDTSATETTTAARARARARVAATATTTAIAGTPGSRLSCEPARSSSRAKAKHVSKQSKSSKSPGPGTGPGPSEDSSVNNNSNDNNSCKAGKKKEGLLASNGKAIKAFPIQMIAQPPSFQQSSEDFEPEHEPRASARPSTSSSASASAATDSRKNSDSSRGSLDLALAGPRRGARSRSRSSSAAAAAAAAVSAVGTRSRNAAVRALAPVREPPSNSTKCSTEREPPTETCPPPMEPDAAEATKTPAVEVAAEEAPGVIAESANTGRPDAPRSETPVCEEEGEEIAESSKSGALPGQDLLVASHQQEHQQKSEEQHQQHQQHHHQQQRQLRTPRSSSSSTPRSARSRGDPRLCSREQANRAKAALMRLQSQLVEEEGSSNSHGHHGHHGLSQQESLAAFELGDRVWVAVSKSLRAAGSVRYSGETSFAKGVWLGLELDDEVGKNDGGVAGVRYFECAQGRGLFCRPSFVAKECADLES